MKQPKMTVKFFPKGALEQVDLFNCISEVSGVPLKANHQAKSDVAVGTGIAPRPPHGPGRARLTHPVLIAGKMWTDRGSHEHPLQPSPTRVPTHGTRYAGTEPG